MSAWSTVVSFTADNFDFLHHSLPVLFLLSLMSGWLYDQQWSFQGFQKQRLRATETHFSKEFENSKIKQGLGIWQFEPTLLLLLILCRNKKWINNSNKYTNNLTYAKPTTIISALTEKSQIIELKPLQHPQDNLRTLKGQSAWKYFGGGRGRESTQEAG